MIFYVDMRDGYSESKKRRKQKEILLVSEKVHGV